MEIYLVGGAVRDELLGLPVAERDWVVVGSSVEEMLAQGYRPVGKDFPVFLHPHSNEEYALARTERKKGSGHRGFQIHTSPELSLEEDLQRRDLTINAMAKNASGKIIDPYGGQQDLQARVLRHVSDAFIEDPLRVLRVARFAAKFASLGFTIADETLQLMQRMVKTGELKELPPERIWQETRNALATESPGKFFVVLYTINALAQTHAGISKPFENKQAREHGLACLDSSTLQTPCARFAAFVGGLYFNQTMHGHERARERACREVYGLTEQLRLPNACKELLTLTVALQHPCHQIFDLDARQFLDLLHRLDARRKPERLAKLLDVFSTVYKSVTNKEEYVQADWLRRAAKTIAEIDVSEWKKEGASNEKLADNLERAQLELLTRLIKEKRMVD